MLSQRIRKYLRVTAIATLVAYIPTNISFANINAPMTEIAIPAKAQLSQSLALGLPAELGRIESLHPGHKGTILHIQTAHGHYEAQQKIEKILSWLSKKYGSYPILLEGAEGKLDPKLLEFFPNRPEMNLKNARWLAKKALVTGPELYLLQNQKAQGFGIETEAAYRKNHSQFVRVLMSKKATEHFSELFNREMEKAATLFSPELRGFLKRLEQIELGVVPFESWLPELQKAALKYLKLDLNDAAWQVRWPMLVRLFKIQSLSKGLDVAKYKSEKQGFLNEVKRYVSGLELYGRVELLLNSFGQSIQLPEPETENTFIEMLRYLPRDFDFKAYPNVTKFIGTLALQSELNPALLMGEINRLEEIITDHLARNENEKKLIAVFSDYRRLEKLLALQLTPGDYAAISDQRAVVSVKPSQILNRLQTTDYRPQAKAEYLRGVDLESSKVSSGSLVKKAASVPGLLSPVSLAELDKVFEEAISFYQGAQERDQVMTRQIEVVLKKQPAKFAVVVTGGFHTEPMREQFEKAGYTYAVVTPAISSLDEAGYQAYLKAMVRTVNSDHRSVVSVQSAAPNQMIELALGSSRTLGKGTHNQQLLATVNGVRAKLLIEEWVASRHRETAPNARGGGYSEVPPSLLPTNPVTYSRGAGRPANAEPRPAAMFRSEARDLSEMSDDQLVQELWSKISPKRRGGFQNHQDIPKDLRSLIAREARNVITEFQKMLTVDSQDAPDQTDILKALKDANLLDVYKIGKGLPPTLVFDGEIFRNYPGPKPYRIAITLGNDFVATHVTHSEKINPTDLRIWKSREYLDHPLSQGFNLQRFLSSKGGTRFYQEGAGELQGVTLEQKYAGIDAQGGDGKRIRTKHLLVENADLSRGMNNKAAPGDVPWWGGKSIVVARSGADKKDVFQKWVASSITAGFLGQLYLAGPDMGTADMMAEIQKTADEVHQSMNLPLARVTTSMEGESASFRHQEWTVTSITGMEAFLEVIRDQDRLKSLGFRPDQPIDIVIQGFGDVGAGYVRYLNERYPHLLGKKVRIVGVSNIQGGIYDPEGLDVPELLRLSSLGFNANLFNSYGLGDTSVERRASLHEVKSGEDIYFVRSQFLDDHYAQNPIVAFPAANPGVIKSNVDVEKLARANVKVIIASANNFLKEDAGLDLALESKGILFFDAPFVSLGGINTSGQEINHIYTHGIERVREVMRRDPDFYRIHVQSGITHLVVSLTRWLLAAYELRDRRQSVTAIHQDLSRQIRERKAYLLERPTNGLLNRVNSELNRIWKNRENEFKANPGLWDEATLIVILTIVTEYAREDVMYDNDHIRQMILDLDSQDALSRRIAIYELGRKRHYGIEGRLLDILNDENETLLVRAATAEALSHLSYEAAVPDLKRVFELAQSKSAEVNADPNWNQLRVQAQWAIDKISNRSEARVAMDELKEGQEYWIKEGGEPNGEWVTLNRMDFEHGRDSLYVRNVNGGSERVISYYDLKELAARSEMREWSNPNSQKIVVIGTGFVGATKAVLASTDYGHDVVGVEASPEKREKLARGEPTFTAKYFPELLKAAVDSGKLNFTSNSPEDLAAALLGREIVYLALPTPQSESGEADIRFLKDAVRQIANAVKPGERKILIGKSTAPPKMTVDALRAVVNEVLAQRREREEMVQDTDIQFAWEPEFLREGAEVEDDRELSARIVIGAETPEVAARVKAVYENFNPNLNPPRKQLKIITTDLVSAPLVKYAANGWRGTKISFINYISWLTEELGFDIDEIANAIGEDSRVVRSFLNCGLGFGGSCFPKDLAAFVKMAKDLDVSPGIVLDALAVNQVQVDRFVSQMINELDGVSGKKIVILGGAFKPETSDTREARSIIVARELLAKGANVIVVDPDQGAIRELERELQGYGARLKFYTSLEKQTEIFSGASAIALVTEWKQFKQIDFNEVSRLFPRATPLPKIFDGRNTLNAAHLRELGFEYFDLGRGLPQVGNGEKEKFINSVKLLFLSLRISYMNTLAEMAEKLGANIHDVKLGFGYDPVVSNAAKGGSIDYLNPGIGYGGYHLPKAIDQMTKYSNRSGLFATLNQYDAARVAILEKFGIPLESLESARVPFVDTAKAINQRQIKVAVEKIKRELNVSSLAGVKIAVAGLAHKQGENIDSSPSIALIQALAAEGAEINAWDPDEGVRTSVLNQLKKTAAAQKVKYFGSIHEAMQGTAMQVIAYVTPELLKDPEKLVKSADGQVAASFIFDARHIFVNPAVFSQFGIAYTAVGMPTLRSESRGTEKNEVNPVSEKADFWMKTGIGALAVGGAIATVNFLINAFFIVGTGDIYLPIAQWLGLGSLGIMIASLFPFVRALNLRAVEIEMEKSAEQETEVVLPAQRTAYHSVYFSDSARYQDVSEYSVDLMQADARKVLDQISEAITDASFKAVFDRAIQKSMADSDDRHPLFKLYVRDGRVIGLMGSIGFRGKLTGFMIGNSPRQVKMLMRTMNASEAAYHMFGPHREYFGSLVTGDRLFLSDTEDGMKLKLVTGTQRSEARLYDVASARAALTKIKDHSDVPSEIRGQAGRYLGGLGVSGGRRGSFVPRHVGDFLRDVERQYPKVFRSESRIVIGTEVGDFDLVQSASIASGSVYDISDASGYLGQVTVELGADNILQKYWLDFSSSEKEEEALRSALDQKTGQIWVARSEARASFAFKVLAVLTGAAMLLLSAHVGAWTESGVLQMVLRFGLFAIASFVLNVTGAYYGYKSEGKDRPLLEAFKMATLIFSVFEIAFFIAKPIIASIGLGGVFISFGLKLLVNLLLEYPLNLLFVRGLFAIDAQGPRGSSAWQKAWAGVNQNFIFAQIQGYFWMNVVLYSVPILASIFLPPAIAVYFSIYGLPILTAIAVFFVSPRVGRLQQARLQEKSKTNIAPARIPNAAETLAANTVIRHFSERAENLPQGGILAVLGNPTPDYSQQVVDLILKTNPGAVLIVGNGGIVNGVQVRTPEYERIKEEVLSILDAQGLAELWRDKIFFSENDKSMHTGENVKVVAEIVARERKNFEELGISADKMTLTQMPAGMLVSRRIFEYQWQRNADEYGISDIKPDFLSYAAAQPVVVSGESLSGEVGDILRFIIWGPKGDGKGQDWRLNEWHQGGKPNIAFHAEDHLPEETLETVRQFLIRSEAREIREVQFAINSSAAEIAAASVNRKVKGEEITLVPLQKITDPQFILFRKMFEQTLPEGLGERKDLWLVVDKLGAVAIVAAREVPKDDLNMQMRVDAAGEELLQRSGGTLELVDDGSTLAQLYIYSFLKINAQSKLRMDRMFVAFAEHYQLPAQMDFPHNGVGTHIIGNKDIVRDSKGFHFTFGYYADGEFSGALSESEPSVVNEPAPTSDSKLVTAQTMNPIDIFKDRLMLEHKNNSGILFNKIMAAIAGAVLGAVASVLIVSGGAGLLGALFGGIVGFFGLPLIYGDVFDIKYFDEIEKLLDAPQSKERTNGLKAKQIEIESGAYQSLVPSPLNQVALDAIDFALARSETRETISAWKVFGGKDILPQSLEAFFLANWNESNPLKEVVIERQDPKDPSKTVSIRVEVPASLTVSPAVFLDTWFEQKNAGLSFHDSLERGLIRQVMLSGYAPPQVKESPEQAALAVARQIEDQLGIVEKEVGLTQEKTAALQTAIRLFTLNYELLDSHRDRATVDILPTQLQKAFLKTYGRSEKFILSGKMGGTTIGWSLATRWGILSWRAEEPTHVDAKGIKLVGKPRGDIEAIEGAANRLGDIVGRIIQPMAEYWNRSLKVSGEVYEFKDLIRGYVLSAPGWFDDQGQLTANQSNIANMNRGYHFDDPKNQFSISAQLLSKHGISLLGRTLHDGTAHAMGEMSRLYGTGAKNFVYLGPGSGVAHRVMVNGEPFTGGEEIAYIQNELPNYMFLQNRTEGGVTTWNIDWDLGLKISSGTRLAPDVAIRTWENQTAGVAKVRRLKEALDAERLSVPETETNFIGYVIKNYPALYKRVNDQMLREMGHGIVTLIVQSAEKFGDRYPDYRADDFRVVLGGKITNQADLDAVKQGAKEVAESFDLTSEDIDRMFVLSAIPDEVREFLAAISIFDQIGKARSEQRVAPLNAEVALPAVIFYRQALDEARATLLGWLGGIVSRAWISGLNTIQAAQKIGALIGRKVHAEVLPDLRSWLARLFPGKNFRAVARNFKRTVPFMLEAVFLERLIADEKMGGKALYQFLSELDGKVKIFSSDASFEEKLKAKLLMRGAMPLGVDRSSVTQLLKDKLDISVVPADALVSVQQNYFHKFTGAGLFVSDNFNQVNDAVMLVLDDALAAGDVAVLIALTRVLRASAELGDAEAAFNYLLRHLGNVNRVGSWKWVAKLIEIVTADFVAHELTAVSA